MLASIFADLSPALAISISASLQSAIQSGGYRSDFGDKSEFIFAQT